MRNENFNNIFTITACGFIYSGQKMEYMVSSTVKWIRIFGERLRVIISEIKLFFNAYESASFGIVKVNPDNDVDMMMYPVDQARYRVKKIRKKS